jgi:DNA-binding TFAR19-related protein (PDSD5 family)
VSKWRDEETSYRHCEQQSQQQRERERDCSLRGQTQTALDSSALVRQTHLMLQRPVALTRLERQMINLQQDAQHKGSTEMALLLASSLPALHFLQ